ncbi:MAG: nucleotidyltransferase substrate binding protein [Endomicrobium sp.]|jgi:nucleotidyltransferase substrate binding protein (TIGR01987 family)|nr:nucleotidyltransferase substrate binding protein [Endomicrobium sp.]
MTIAEIDISNLEKAIKSFENAIKAAEDTKDKAQEYIKDTIRAGVVQNFEFTYELSWKYIQRYLELNNQIDTTVPKKQLFREAFENGLLDAPDSWFKYHEARNKTSHMYSQAASELVYELSNDFIKDVKNLLHNLVSANEK